jgi:hypothetical protein
MQSDTYQELFCIAEETVSLADRALGDERAAESVEQQVWWALLRAFALKAVTSLRATVLLCREGYSEDAAVVARTIMEIAIVVRYIAADPQDRSRRFIEHTIVERQSLVTFLESARDRLPRPWQGLASHAQRLQELRQHYDEMSGDTRHRYHWAGRDITLRKMAEAIGLPVLDWYDLIYSLFSKRAHSTPRCMDNYILVDGQRLINSLPDRAGMVRDSLGFGSLSMLLVLDTANDEMRLTLESEIKGLMERFRQVRRAAGAGGENPVSESRGASDHAEESE